MCVYLLKGPGRVIDGSFSTVNTCTRTHSYTHTHTVEVGGERGGHMQQFSANIIHPVFICVSPPFPILMSQAVCISHFIYMATHTEEHTGTHIKEHRMEAT